MQPTRKHLAESFIFLSKFVVAIFTNSSQVKSVMKRLVRNEMVTKVEEVLYYALRKVIHNLQSRARSILSPVLEHVMLDLLGKEVIPRPLGSHITEFFETGPAAKGLSERLLASSSFMTPIATFIRGESDSA